MNKVAKLDQAGQQAYRDALKKRNYIAHDFFLKNTYAFSEEEIFQKTMDRLKSDTKTIALAAAISSGLLEGVCSALKIDKSEVVVEQST